MPQLDKFIFVSQYFWLFLLFFLAYYVLVRRTLPALLGALKFRKMRLLSLSSAVRQLDTLGASKPPLLRRSLDRFNVEFGDHLGGLVRDFGVGFALPSTPIRHLGQTGFHLPLLSPPPQAAIAHPLRPTSPVSEAAALNFALAILARLPRPLVAPASAAPTLRLLAVHWVQSYLLLGSLPPSVSAAHSLSAPLRRAPIAAPLPPTLVTFLLRQWSFDAYAELLLLIDPTPTATLPAALFPLRAVSRSFLRLPKQFVAHSQR